MNTNGIISAAQVQLEPAKSNFSLFYNRYPMGNTGLNLTIAKSGWSISNIVLNSKDVNDLEAWFATQSITGQYKATKAGHWVRCMNQLSVDQMVALTRYLMANKQTISFRIK